MIDFALTLHRPWPWCIFFGGGDHYSKPLENRSWKPPAKVIGTRIAVHAGKVYGLDAERYLVSNVYAALLPRRAHDEGIVGTAVVCGVVQARPGFDRLDLVMGEWGDVSPGDAWRWFSGPYGWLLAERRGLNTPIPCKGAQGLWRVPSEIGAALETAPLIAVNGAMLQRQKEPT